MKLRDALRLGASGDSAAVDDFGLSTDDLDALSFAVSDAALPELDVAVLAGSMLAAVENDLSLVDDPDALPLDPAGDLAIGTDVTTVDEGSDDDVPDEAVDLDWGEHHHLDLGPDDDWSTPSEPDPLDGPDDHHHHDVGDDVG